MTTANTIIRDAMIDIGASGMTDVPEPDDSAHALRILNRMIDSWASRSLFAFHVQWQSITLTSAMQTRTIGSGGQVNVTRPVRVVNGSFTSASGLDRELKVATRDQWAQIGIKTLIGDRPEWVYYEAGSPLGTLHFWPQGDCTVKLALEEQLTSFADLTTNYTLPPGNEECIVLSLSEKLCRPFSRPIPPQLARDAANARRHVKRLNFSVPELDMPAGRAGGTGTDSEFIAG